MCTPARPGLIHVSTSGSGDIFTRAVSGGVEASIAGSSDIRIASVSGPVKVRIAGSGDLNIDGGHATDLSASIAGSGDVNFHGVGRNPVGVHRRLRGRQRRPRDRRGEEVGGRLRGREHGR